MTLDTPEFIQYVKSLSDSDLRALLSFYETQYTVVLVELLMRERAGA